MLRLRHFALCPFSRSIRLALQELNLPHELVSESADAAVPGARGLALPADLPLLELEEGGVVAGAYAISEYLDELVARGVLDARSPRLFPGPSEDRAEARRLVDWFHRRLDREITQPLLAAKAWPRLASAPPTGAPSSSGLRAAHTKLRLHLDYMGYLADTRRWLAGDTLSFADLAAAAHLSTLDYLAEIPWEEAQSAKDWYARVKSRPSFRPLLADRMTALPPPAHYADLDF
ncbi:MAG: glutathione S-transferase family protein [Hyphomicrobium sp.]|uniref:glutathione S-transferase family protein n=1 Tax=Hyphomicrobium sp. CS1BSMeth3 TaxID=1892844 RepID=UPI00092FE1BE|nr:glutathione S-transferase family protein [Hyphomicrobium sp. CS1BSMeth3]MBN9260086.1 glutathione S-transferase family protein [Hyphomicrobium sp.]MBN9266007.1 glutathione S-transferase family protein [Hyphomicrobium sp.]MBN9280572.1 glutathione S-transferase family protein [Hyphomicrobium sp.]